MKKACIVVGILCLVFAGCSKEGGDSGETEAPERVLDNAATSIGSNVNVRSSASTDAAVVASLNAGDKVGIISTGSEYVMIGKYYGRWLNVETEDGAKGYVLSSFIQAPGEDLEKFHVFFDRFYPALLKQDMSVVEKHVSFPLEYGIFFEGEGEMETIEKGDFFHAMVGGEPMYEPTFDLHENGDVVCSYGYEGVQYSLYFRPVHGTWRLVKLTGSAC